MNPRLAACLAAACALAMPFPDEAAAQAAAADVLEAAVTIDAATIEIELRVPAQALLGFAHRPRSADEKADAAELHNALLRPPTLLTPNAAAGCMLQTVMLDDRALQPVDEPTPAPRTSMVALRYRFECLNLAALSVLELNVFELFPRVQRVRAEVESGPRTYTRDARRPLKVLPLN